MAVQINQGTQTQILTETAGAVEIGVVKVDMSASGTYGVSMFEGTLLRLHTIGTLPNLPGGTITSVTEVANLAKGTITRLEGGTVQANLLTGTVTAVTEVANLAKGTVTRLEGGTVQTNILTGTVTSITNLASGTLAAVTSVTNLVGGTLTRLTDGTVRIPAGTITSVTDVANLAKGTITRVEGGSIAVTAGTMRLNPNPTQVTQSFGTTTTGTIGTLVAAPSAGSAIFITNLTISVQSGTVEPVVSFNLAANGNGVVNRGLYVAGGGAVIPFPVPNSANNTGTALTWNILSGSGTVSYNVSYFIAVP